MENEKKPKMAYPMVCSDCGKEILIEVTYPQTEDEWKTIQRNMNKKGRCTECQKQYDYNYYEYE